MPASVLIVDDIAPNIKLLTAQLERENFHVYTAQSGQDAVDIINTHKPDVILLDIMMPGMSGYEVCKLVKDNPDTHHIPVILVTALDDIESHDKGYDVGANDILMKPVDHKTLKARLLVHLDLKLLGDALKTHCLTAEQFDLSPPDHDVLAHDTTGYILIIGTTSQAMTPYEDSFIKDKHRVTSVDNFERAHHILDAQHFDCVFTTPQVDWRKALQIKIKTKYRPTIVLSYPQHQYDHIMPYVHSGEIDDAVPTDFGHEQLRARLRSHMQQRRIKDDIRHYLLRADVEKSFKDPLSHHLTQDYGEAHCQNYIDHMASEHENFGVLVINIDGFDQLNARLGESVGNQILHEMGDRLYRFCPQYFTIIRLHDKDFCLAIPNVHRNQLFRMAYYIHNQISLPPYHISTAEGPQSIKLSVSVGGCLEKISNTPNITDMIDRGDLAAYEAKDSGGNCVYFEGMGRISRANI